MGKRKSAGQPWVRCPALVLCGLQNRGGRNQLGAHQQHEGSRGCPPGTLPCLQGIVCYTCRPQGCGNGAQGRAKRPLPRAGKRLRGLAGIQSQGRPLTRWYAMYLGRYCQSSHSLLWASHHAWKFGSFGERVRAAEVLRQNFSKWWSAKRL